MVGGEPDSGQHLLAVRRRRCGRPGRRRLGELRGERPGLAAAAASAASSASTATSASARRWRTAWNRATGRPNCSRPSAWLRGEVDHDVGARPTIWWASARRAQGWRRGRSRPGPASPRPRSRRRSHPVDARRRDRCPAPPPRRHRRSGPCTPARPAGRADPVAVRTRDRGQAGRAVGRGRAERREQGRDVVARWPAQSVRRRRRSRTRWRWSGPARRTRSRSRRRARPRACRAIRGSPSAVSASVVAASASRTVVVEQGALGRVHHPRWLGRAPRASPSAFAQSRESCSTASSKSYSR